jgi:2-dehydro-3-deoxygluconokinase
MTAPAADAPPSRPTGGLVTLGETMASLLAPGVGPLRHQHTLHLHIGGAESNVAISVARLGGQATWVGRVGDDELGDLVLAQLRGEGVDVRHAVRDDGAPTGLMLKSRRTPAVGRVTYYRRGSAGSRLAPSDVPVDAVRAAGVLHVTGITPALSASCAAAVEQAQALARAAGALVSVDPNVRPQLWPTAQACRETLRALMARADLVLLGHEDAEVLYPGLTEDAVIDAVRAGGAATVVLKLGERGAVAVQDGVWARVEAHPVRVVDTVGAGDGFDAGFVAAWLRGFPLPRCLALAARIGAAAVAVAGDWEGYPTAQEVGL